MNLFSKVCFSEILILLFDFHCHIFDFILIFRNLLFTIFIFHLQRLQVSLILLYLKKKWLKNILHNFKKGIFLQNKSARFHSYNWKNHRQNKKCDWAGNFLNDTNNQYLSISFCCSFIRFCKPFYKELIFYSIKK